MSEILNIWRDSNAFSELACMSYMHTCTKHNTDLKTIGLGVELYDPPLYTKMFLKGILQL